MAEIIDHGIECDGYYIIVALSTGEKRRLHATKQPKDIQKWVDKAEVDILKAYEDEVKSKKEQIRAEKREALSRASTTVNEISASAGSPQEKERLSKLSRDLVELQTSADISSELRKD